MNRQDAGSTGVPALKATCHPPGVLLGLAQEDARWQKGKNKNKDR